MNTKPRMRAVRLLLAILALSAPALCGPILPGVFSQFSYGAAGTPAAGCFPDDPAATVVCIPSFGTPTVFLDAPPWTFNSTSNIQLIVVDTFESGDRFEIFDLGSLDWPDIRAGHIRLR